MKKIGILFPSDPRRGGVGGVKKVALEIGKTLINSGKYKISYIFMDNKKSSEIQNGISYIGIKTLGFFPFDILFFSWKLKSFKLDLMVDNMGIANLYNNINKKTKILSICHGIAGGAIRNLDVGNRILKVKYFIYYLFLHLLRKITYKKSDMIIIAPKGGKELIHKYYRVSNSKIQIVYNGVDFVSKDIKPFDGVLRICFISNNHPRRGIHRLEIVAKTLEKEKVIFKIIGSNYNNHRKIKNIDYLGTLIGEKKYKEIANNDIVFMPSCYEGQNLSVLEGMSVGCIPLISKNTNTNMIEGTELEQFISLDNDVDFYVQKILYLLQNTKKIDILKKMSQNVIKKYTRDKQTKKILDIINKML